MLKDIRKKKYQHIIISPEQCARNGAQQPMFTHLLENQQFASSISCINFDEAHFIVTSGEPDKENKIFRIEYSKCFEIRLRLSLKTPCTVFSATMPPIIQDKILKSLKLPTDVSKTCFISLSTNRPNLCFAVKKLTGTLANLSNLDFLVSRPYHPPIVLKKKNSDLRAN